MLAAGEHMAKTLSPEGSPIGRSYYLGDASSPKVQVTELLDCVWITAYPAITSWSTYWMAKAGLVPKSRLVFTNAVGSTWTKNRLLGQMPAFGAIVRITDLLANCQTGRRGMPN
jgi:hypothetical protein